MRPTDAARTQTVRPSIANRRFASRGLVPAAVLAGSLGATSLAGAATSQPVVTTAKIAGLGTVLEASHRVLYEMASDPKGHTTCTGACTKVWKPLIVSSNQAHHLGHVSGIGTIHRPNGQLQVAIHGHALYWFVNDHSKSDAAGQGFLKNWYTVKSNGTLDRATTSGATTTVPPTTPSGSGSSSSSTTRPTSAPMSPNSPAPAGPAPTSPPPASPPPTSPPPTAPPPPPPTTTTTSPPTTTTTSGGGGGVGF